MITEEESGRLSPHDQCIKAVGTGQKTISQTEQESKQITDGMTNNKIDSTNKSLKNSLKKDKKSTITLQEFHRSLPDTSTQTISNTTLHTTWSPSDEIRSRLLEGETAQVEAQKAYLDRVHPKGQSNKKNIHPRFQKPAPLAFHPNTPFATAPSNHPETRTDRKVRHTLNQLLFQMRNPPLINTETKEELAERNSLSQMLYQTPAQLLESADHGISNLSYLREQLNTLILSTMPLSATSPKKYKNWLKKRHLHEGLCYLLLYKRQYRYSAWLMYGSLPLLHHINLDPQYLSEKFHELNVAINYPRGLIHVYSTTHVTYDSGFERMEASRVLLKGYHHGFKIGSTGRESPPLR